jgi:hypothetical protein
MLEDTNNEHVLFLDIETTPQYSDYNELPERFKELWDKKASYLKVNDESAEELYARAGIYAEFGKIVCISVGYIFYRNDEPFFRVKSFYNDDEKTLLQAFANALNSFVQNKKNLLCAHNGKEFDFPYIARRMLVNGLPLPDVLKVHGKKPWEVTFIDTMELWKFGDRKNFTSLNLLTAIFNIPSPKEDIDGSMVGEVYWKENNLKRIADYCENDVLAIAQLFLKYKGEPIIPAGNVEKANH